MFVYICICIYIYVCMCVCLEWQCLVETHLPPTNGISTYITIHIIFMNVIVYRIYHIFI